MLRIYCLLTGDDYLLVKSDTPASKRKIELLATSLFVPVILWFANTTLLMKNVLNTSLHLAIIGGVFVSLIVFIIERAVIMSSKSRLMAAFRIMLGFIVALLGSIIIDEVIFVNDINQQMILNNQQAAKEEIASVQAYYQNILNQKKIVLQSLYGDWQKSKDEVNNEMKGGPGSSGFKGKGAIADVNIRMAESQRLEYENAKTDLREAEKGLDARTKEVGKSMEKQHKDHFLLTRIKATCDLVCNDWSMSVVYGLFTFLLFLLEFLVVIIKMTSDETNYERKVKAIEQIGCERIQRIVSKDNVFFDPGGLYQTVKHAKSKINEPSPAIFS